MAVSFSLSLSLSLSLSFLLWGADILHFHQLGFHANLQSRGKQIRSCMWTGYFAILRHLVHERGGKCFEVTNENIIRILAEIFASRSQFGPFGLSQDDSTLTHRVPLWGPTVRDRVNFTRVQPFLCIRTDPGEECFFPLQANTVG